MPSNSDLANAIRALSMDAVERAQSGHPGMPMGMATIAEVLWREFLQHNPVDPQWHNRDRFVLSNGHGSMLLYSLLHLSGYDVSIGDLQAFRQLHSKTPGHPEWGETPGVETTTGPLGQGFANAVGMALAEKTLAAQFNRQALQIINHHTYVFLGDGCLMEGISHEAASLAGTLGLGKLIAFWDDNGISIDGEVQNWCKDDVAARFRAYGWQVISAVDGHDRQAIVQAVLEGQQDSDRPTLICCRTIIGFGSPNKAGSEKSHGAPLGTAEVEATREFLAWPHAAFVIPEEIYQAWDAKESGQRRQQEWQATFGQYEQRYPELANQLQRRLAKQLPSDWSSCLQSLLQKMQQTGDKIATRKASQLCLQAFAEVLPELFGGSADLSASNLTTHNSSVAVHVKEHGNYLFYGVREFAMAAMMNGLALHGGFIPYGGTFLVFADYARNAMRLSALMKQPVIYVMTHDSIGLGEDGPTHQPVEHLTMLRATPNTEVWRPCDAVETAVAWQAAIESQHTPSVLALSRQALPMQQRSQQQLEAIHKGGYVLRETRLKLRLIIMATGSEVSIAIDAASQLEQLSIGVRVLSMPCVEKFLQQPKEYQEEILPSAIRARVAVEAGRAESWHQFVGLEGAVVGLKTFGVSAPAVQAYEDLGITTEKIVQQAQHLLKTDIS